jgi:hypothetical protein
MNSPLQLSVCTHTHALVVLLVNRLDSFDDNNILFCLFPDCQVVHQRKLNVESLVNYLLQHYELLRNVDVQDYDFSVIDVLLDNFTALCVITLSYRTRSSLSNIDQYSAFVFYAELFTGN